MPSPSPKPSAVPVTTPSRKRKRKLEEADSGADDDYWGGKLLLSEFHGSTPDGSCSIPYTPTIDTSHPSKRLLFTTRDRRVQEAILLLLSEVSSLTART